jgi:hypothetical protein
MIENASSILRLFRPLENDSVFVMAGLRPGHPRLSCLGPQDVDARHKAGHDELYYSFRQQVRR